MIKETFKSLTPYPFFSCICTTSKLDMNAAKRARDCFPLPPTPTNRALPRGDSKMRLILERKMFFNTFESLADRECHLDYPPADVHHRILE